MFNLLKLSVKYFYPLSVVILNSNFEVSYFIYFILLMSVYFHQISTGWEFYCYVNKRSNFIFLNSIFAGFLGFLLYIILIPSFQILGALISIFLTKVIHMLSLMIYARKHGYKGNIIDKNTYHKLIIFMLCILLFFISDFSFSQLSNQFNSLIKFL